MLLEAGNSIFLAIFDGPAKILNFRALIPLQTTMDYRENIFLIRTGLQGLLDKFLEDGDFGQYVNRSFVLYQHEFGWILTNSAHRAYFLLERGPDMDDDGFAKEMYTQLRKKFLTLIKDEYFTVKNISDFVHDLRIDYEDGAGFEAFDEDLDEIINYVEEEEDKEEVISTSTMYFWVDVYPTLSGEEKVSLGLDDPISYRERVEEIFDKEEKIVQIWATGG